MRKTLLLLALAAFAALAVSVAAAVLWWRRGEPQWSTRSPAAAKEVDAGLASMMKYYLPEANSHFERALELDPDLAVAKVFAAVTGRRDPQSRRRVADELAKTPIGDLKRRERFLVDLYSARLVDDDAAARRIVEAYLAEGHQDPLAAYARCEMLWKDQALDEAEGCYRDVLERWPNWVQAQNHLGYLAMAQGRFSQAEERFRTYLFIAPDQANPYDSLGQLLLLVGRYEEAEEALEKAIEIRPDFCESRLQLARLHLLTARFEAMRETVAAGREVCSGWRDGQIPCRLLSTADYYERGPEAGWEALAACPAKKEIYDGLRHRFAVSSGRLEEAERLESALAAAIAEAAAPLERDWRRALLAHERGVRELASGDPAAAVGHFREAEAQLVYWGDDGTAKLVNRFYLVHALEAAGDAVEATAWRNKAEAVNPRFADSPLVREIAGLVAARVDGEGPGEAAGPS